MLQLNQLISTERFFFFPCCCKGCSLRLTFNVFDRIFRTNFFCQTSWLVLPRCFVWFHRLDSRHGAMKRFIRWKWDQQYFKLHVLVYRWSHSHYLIEEALHFRKVISHVFSTILASVDQVYHDINSVRRRWGGIPLIELLKHITRTISRLYCT